MSDYQPYSISTLDIIPEDAEWTCLPFAELDNLRTNKEVDLPAPPKANPKVIAFRDFLKFVKNDSKGGAIAFEHSETNLNYFKRYTDSYESSIKRDTLSLFKIIDVFGENDFTIQFYDNSQLLKEMEDCLQGICESELTYHPNKRLDLKLLNRYAVKSYDHKKWVRCALIHLIQVNSPNPKAVFSLLDYGSWVSLSLPRERYSEYIQDLPATFWDIRPQGYTAGQYYGYTAKTNRRVPFDALKELKDSVVLALVKDCLPPANGREVVSHLTVSIINVHKLARQKKVRRKSI